MPVRSVQIEGPHPVDLALGRRIRELRVAQGMSQTQLGTGIGLTFQQVQKYERGANRIGASRLAAIAKTLHTTPAALLDGIGLRGARSSRPIDRLTLQLAKAFGQVRNEQLRRAVVTLVRSIAQAVSRGWWEFEGGVIS